MTPRTDHHTAALFSLALFLRHMIDRNAAAGLLARNGIPLATVRRVLSSTRRRFAAGRPDPSAPF